MSDIDTVTVDSLKTLDPNRPIREADIHEIAFAKQKDRLAAVCSIYPIRCIDQAAMAAAFFRLSARFNRHLKYKFDQPGKPVSQEECPNRTKP